MLAICLTSTIKFRDPIQNETLDTYLAKIKNGDKEALAALYQETKSSVYGFALSILKNPQDVEDCLQDTYIQVFNAAKTYTSHGKPMAYILTIARNLCLMKLRADKKTVDISEEKWNTFVAENDNLSSEDKLVLAAFLKLLTDEEKQIVTLYAISGFKHREISQILDLPLSTVLSKYNRAMKKLKKQYAEGGKEK
ncbi:MAG: RNA polymerase sigma factor [Oscillospiraceae bacterium]